MPVERLIALALLTALAVAVATILQRRRPDPPSAPSYRAPAQLDRDDFRGHGDLMQRSGPVVVEFSSRSCDSCPRAWRTIESTIDSVPEWSERIPRLRVDVQDEPDLHRRYRIDGVPTTVVADGDGVVLQAFFGPIAEHELRDALRTALG